MPKITDQHRQMRRQQIIDAAYQCFARKGFHQTTMRDIYTEASLSPGAIYSYFDSKDEIIQASFVFDHQRSLDVFHAAKAGADPLKALEELLDFLFKGLKEAAALGAGRVNVQAWGEALVNPPLLETIRSVLSSYLDSVSQLIRMAQESGQIDRSLDSYSVSRVVASLYYGLELQKSLDDEVDVDKYAAAAKALLRSFSQSV